MIQNKPLISVILPIYEQKHFLNRAIASLEAQLYSHWELIIIDDGSKDKLDLPPQHYLRNEENKGLGYTLNRGMEHAKGEWITYLPADDIYFKDHLQSLIDTATKHPSATLLYSSIQHHYNKKSAIVGDHLQLVQVMHKNNGHRWKERVDLESDHLGWLFFDSWNGEKIHTGITTCVWTDHPLQRHKLMQEPIGGIHPFREYYQIKTPLRFQSSCGHLIDESLKYQSFQKKQYSISHGGLKILILGELAYNADRMLALKERGHQLFGLWMKKPYWYNSIGPMPFGQIEDLDADQWKKEIERIKPDVIYGLLNWQAVPFIHQIINQIRDIPFCFHFKEGPFICIEKGSWKELIELYQRANGRIYCSMEMKVWFDQFLSATPTKDLILDGDLPKKEWFDVPRSSRISNTQDGIHTVVPGRPIGLHPKDVGILAAQNIHLHFYGEFTHGQWKEWIKKSWQLAPDHLHIHPNVEQDKWVSEFSKYDAGWLHVFKSENHGELMRCNWDDLNIPARMATLAQAGLPMIQWNNQGHLVATQNITKQKNVGIFLNSFEELSHYLLDHIRMDNIRTSVWNFRHQFTFDEHTDSLINYFKTIIQHFHKQEQNKKHTSSLHPK